jgi:tetratricopeptide (TPR) repeat protein
MASNEQRRDHIDHLKNLASWLSVSRPELAEPVLNQLETEGQPVAAARIRAKLLAQSGRFDEAIAQWRRVLAVVPNDTEALSGIRAAEQISRSAVRRFFFKPCNKLIVAFSVLLLLGGTAWMSAPRSHSEPPATEREVRGLLSTQADLSVQLKQIRDERLAAAHQREADAKVADDERIVLEKRIDVHVTELELARRSAAEAAAAERLNFTQIAGILRADLDLRQREADDATAEHVALFRRLLAALNRTSPGVCTDVKVPDEEQKSARETLAALAKALECHLNRRTDSVEAVGQSAK